MPLKINYLYLAVLTFIFSNAKAQLNDSFSDGNFTFNPTWTGDTAKYEVDTAFKLHLNAPAISDTAYLATDVGILDMNQPITWTFYTEMAFSPSNTNNVRIYFVADNPNLRGSLNGYYLRIGENGASDRIKIYKQTGLTSTLLFTGSGSIFDPNPTARIRIQNYGNGNWLVESDSTGGTNYITEGSFTDNSFPTTQFIGVYSKYSSSNSTNIWYDDFTVSGTLYVDTISPTVTSINVISSTALDITFDEAVDSTTAVTLVNYSVNNNIGTPQSISLDNVNTALVHLIFSTPFGNGTMDTITIQNIQDLSGNMISITNKDFFYYIPGTPSNRSVVINEIFADPSPPVGLPPGEYIELYNPSNSYFDLSNWTISDGSTTATLPNYVLVPGGYVVIADDNFTYDFSIYPNTIFVTTLPSLNNSADQIVLKDNSSQLIDSVSYSDSWYRSDIKKAGGYSLEQINPKLPCSGSSNWIGSMDNVNGGTPGQQNSVYDINPDTKAPGVVSSNVNSTLEIQLSLSETLDSLTVNLSDFSMDYSIIISSIQLDFDLNNITINLSTPIDTGVIYHLSINGISDCSGNMMNTSTEVILPDIPVAGDIIINEVLYDPYTGGEDFVEVYNNSDKTLDLISFKLANFYNGSIDNYKDVADHFLIKPDQFAVLTTDSNAIKNDYLNARTGKFVQCATLPSYPNDSGTVFLILPDIDSTICDHFSYSSNMQFGLLNNTKGISLERISYDRPTNDNTNWHSAAESAGWATPGFKNSQYSNGVNSSGQITLDSEIFSPDNDGYQDVLTISYNMNTPGYVGNITIFDVNGRIVRNLMQNELLGSSGSISWDGLNDNSEKVRIGNYIIYFEFFNLEGLVNGIKKTCVVASKI